MDLKIIDAWTDPGGAAQNEDSWGHAKFGDVGCAWLIDGCTSLSADHLASPYPHGESSALWYQKTLSNALRSTPYQGIHEDPKTYFTTIVDCVKAKYDALQIGYNQDDWEYPSSTVVWIAYSAAAEILRISWLGDSCCVTCQGDEAVAVFPASRIDRSPLHLVKTDEKRVSALLQDTLHSRRETRARHLRLGERSVSIFPTPLLGLRTVDIPIRARTSILLASDGFSRLWEMFDEVPLQKVFGRIRIDGLPTLGAKLRQLEAENAKLIASIQPKVSDDATAIFLEIPFQRLSSDRRQHE